MSKLIQSLSKIIENTNYITLGRVEMKKDKLQLAGCVILNEKGEILLLHRNTAVRKQWEIPGGKIENGETNKGAAIREIGEELGIRVNILRILGHNDFVEDGLIMGYTWLLAEIKSGVPKIIEKDKFDNLRYFSWRKLKGILKDLSPNTHNLVEAYFRREISL